MWRERKIDRKKAGISGALVAILLVVVAIAFVGIAVAVLSGFIGTGSVKTDILVEKLDLVANGYSVIVLRNSGNVKISSIDDVKLVCQGETVSATINFNPTSIDPGKTSMATFTATLIPGQTCTLTVKATAANGAMVATSSSAIVRP